MLPGWIEEVGGDGGAREVKHREGGEQEKARVHGAEAKVMEESVYPTGDWWEMGGVVELVELGFSNGGQEDRIGRIKREFFLRTVPLPRTISQLERGAVGVKLRHPR